MDLSMLNVLTVTWGIVTTVSVALLILRAVLSTKEEDQLFLNAAESHLEQEQIQLQSRLSTIGRYAMIFGAVSIVLMLTIAGIWTYQQLTRPPIA
ncbi:MAG TPA: hypothetical protein VN841_26310 [Bryobacteraceae bacterium]|nr:hypothetical protein [Bryobacteraceae bacterium]